MQTRPTDIRILDIETNTEQYDYRAPIKFGGNVVRDVTILNVTIRVRNRAGDEAAGFGSMPIGNVWAWPPPPSPPARGGALGGVSPDESEAAMLQLADLLRDETATFDLTAHPLDLMAELEPAYFRLAQSLEDRGDKPLGSPTESPVDPQAHRPTRPLAHPLPEPMPALAVLVVASPFDAAVFDAFGKVNGINSYNGLSNEYVAYDLSHYLDGRFAGHYLEEYTSRQPKPRIPLYHLVGALDPLTRAEITEPLDDGLPESLDQWIAADGLTHLKIKLNGTDLAWDVERVLGVEAVTAPVQEKRGVVDWRYSLDFNEKAGSVEYLLNFLARVREASPAAYNRIAYIEQPTARDLRSQPAGKMHAAAEQKPVVIDESLVDYESLLLAREWGYSGVALKACKGQSQALLMAAAAQHFGMFLCVQDLTCPGASFLHSAGLAARIPPVTAIEGNARQYCPAANQGWAERFPLVFHVAEGTINTSGLTGPGLGH